MEIGIELSHKRTTKGRMVMLVFVSRGRARMGLDIHVGEAAWDKRRKRVKLGVAHAAVINARIAEAVAKAEEIVLRRPNIKPGELRDAMRARPASSDFVEMARERLIKNPPKNFHTLKQRRSTLEQFRRWAGPVDLKDMNAKLMQGYSAAVAERGSGENTVAVQLKRLRTMYRLACKDAQLVPKNILDGCNSVERYTTPPSRLGTEDVLKLMKYADTNQGWKAKAVHLWLFSFFCAGIRWGDICRMKKEHVVDGRLVFIQQKTGKEKDVKLHPYAVKVAGLYNSGPYLFGIAGGKEPTERKIASANVMANRYLKEAANACGIDKRLHTHNARHSFAAQALDAELDDRAIQAALGITPEVYRHYKGQIRPDRVDEELHKVLGGYE